MREWSRSKYFADILTFFPDGINKDSDDLKQFRKINREKDIVIKDFKEAQFVYACFYSNLYKNSIDIKYNDKDTICKLKNAPRISALERTHSYNKIRNLYLNRFLNDDKKLFDDEYFNIQYNPNNYRIIFNDGKLTKINLLSHIYKWWNEKLITTRPFKDKAIELIIDDMNIMVNNINIKNYLTKEELWKIDEFNISEKQLENIILSNEEQYNNQKNVLARFEIAKKIKALSSKLSNKLKNMNIDDNWKKYEKTPIGVLKIFVNQMEFNAPRHYYNAVFISIRSFFELLILFVNCFIDDSNIDRQNEIINCIAKGEEIAAKRTCLYKNLYKEDKNIEYVANRKRFLRILFGTEYNIGEYQEKINTYLWDDQKWKYINRPIHAFHKIYINKDYTEIINEYHQYQELLFYILENANWNQFDELNDKIQSKINAANKDVSSD